MAMAEVMPLMAELGPARPARFEPLLPVAIA
ncbi:hypothetical protein QF000_004282 [Paraburkholderia atlantica]|uniref:Uncharacterized protein n=1 Tax=Paraburkholderia atlantica TaxID=2654982 RepID=A0A7W8PVU7_PARAM|nr:hypothetical protein [Paraburkholderia atlantica]MBB5423042.1 hypothetical protein [Paraburkholderia atlantica]